MKRQLTKTLAWATALAASATIALPATAEDKFPSKTIEVITHAGAGGGTDVNARMMMLGARKTLGTDMVVVNKRGGGGAASMNYFMTRPADGYSILVFTIGHAITMAKGKTKMTVSDIAPLARGTDDPQILMVNCKKGSFKTPEDLVESMKKSKVKFGTTQIGTIDHLTAYIFAKKGGLQQPTIVPFKGGGELATQLVAGAVDVGVLNLSEASAQIDSGDICPLIVMAKKRMKPIPDAKTATELGIPVVLSTVRGFVTQSGVPEDHQKILEKGILKSMQSKIYQSYLTTSGLDSDSPADAKEWGEQIKEMVGEFGPALKEMGLTK